MITLSNLDLKSMSDSQIGELLIEAKNAYYTTDKPIMDDHTYDTLEEILKKKNPHHRIFTKVGNSNFDTGFDKKRHSFILGSQNKVSSFDNIVHYFQLKKIPQNTKFVVQPKCDGLSLEIEYKHGLVVDAITRGDGLVGDVITQNVVKMQNFKHALPSPFTGSVRFEIVVTQTDFKKLNNKVSENTSLPGGTTKQSLTYTNPRNAASGISQRLDSLHSQFCTLFAVDLFSPQKSFQTETDQIDYLKKLGIKVVDTFYCQNFDQIEKIYQDFLTKRVNYPFDIDGLVIKIDDVNLQKQLGSKNNRPKYQVAYKFPSDSNQSQVLSIDWTTGPLGTITPVAQIDPILVSGATISFVSLANLDQIQKLNLNVGDIVEVSRRGDVIPHIEKVISKTTSDSATPPKKCLACHTPLVSDNKFLKCPNSLSCPAQTLGQLNLFCKVLDIKGISSKTIEKLHQSGLVNKPGDFYTLTAIDISKLDNLGDKSAKNIIGQIQAKKHLSLLSVFHSASIPNFSKARIKQLIDAGFNTPQKLLNLSLADLESLPGFKVTLAQKIITGISLRRPIIESILSQVTIKQTSSSTKLKGLSICITGSLSQPRKDIEKLIVDNGGKLSLNVSSNTSYLVTNDTSSNSSKFTTANRLGIPIISEQKLLKLINQ